MVNFPPQKDCRWYRLLSLWAHVNVICWGWALDKASPTSASNHTTNYVDFFLYSAIPNSMGENGLSWACDCITDRIAWTKSKQLTMYSYMPNSVLVFLFLRGNASRSTNNIMEPKLILQIIVCYMMFPNAQGGYHHLILLCTFQK